MTYRNLKYLVNNNIFINFVKKHNFKINIDDTILIVSDCIILEIYGLNVEEIIYFDIYIENYKKYTNVDRLCSNKPNKIISDICKRVRSTHQETLLKSNEINMIVALKAEQNFLSYIEIMDNLLNDFFSCNFNGYEQYFTDSFDISKKILNRKLKELQFVDIDSINSYTKIKN